MDLDAVEGILQKNASEIACVFPTSLLGFVPDIERLKELQIKYDVRVMMDNCENTLGTYLGKNVSSFFTSTTSTYFGHQIQSVEGGFVFTDNEKEYRYFLMARNHGMVRSLPVEWRNSYTNPNVNPKFDFHILGNNFRNTDINAFIGQLDLKRAEKYKNKRKSLFARFRDELDTNEFILPQEFPEREHVAFCFPIILKNPSKRVSEMIRFCEHRGIETRPIISGNLLRQNCLVRYRQQAYTNSEYLHHHGFYVGLHGKVKGSDVSRFTYAMNKLAKI
jgi:CDP-6-deoxy-D-xylo-4-hexulose-3-dehydrase